MKILLLSVTLLISLAPAFAAGIRVTRVTTLSSDGGRVDWSSDNRIAFDRRGADGYFDTFIVNPDGSGSRCLTCDKAALPGRHAGNPTFHPNGRYIVFQAQKLFLGNNAVTDNAANPGAGYYNDVWVMDDQGTRFWRMTDVVALRGGGVLHPKFSNRGDKLLWAERVDNEPLDTFGTWALKLADFSIRADGTPEIGNIRTFQPGSQIRFYESHGFSKDDTHILFAANSEPSQLLVGLDEYMYDYENGVLTNLTGTMGQWDEHGHFSPAGNHVAWTTSLGIVVPPAFPRFIELKLDLWVMHPDGSDKERVTFFNDPGWQFYQPGVQLISDFAWSPDGSRIVGYLVESVVETKGRIAVIDLEFNAVALNSASFTGQTLARGSIATLFGRGFTTTANPARFVVESSGAATALPLPVTMAGSSARLRDSAGVEFDLPFFFVSPRQMNLYVPPEVALGSAAVSVRIAGRTVSTVQVTIGSTAPGLFTANQSGSGVPLAFVVRVNASGNQTITPAYQCPSGPGSCTAVPIDFGSDESLGLVLYGTGIRGDGSPSVTATLGGTPVQILFAGAQSTFLGLDQVNLLLTRSLAGRGDVDLVLTVNGQAANTTRIAIR